MHILLRKINPELRQRRFYALTVSRNLFGEWVLAREWGRYGSPGSGNVMKRYFQTEGQATVIAERVLAQEVRRGYLRAK